MITTRAVPALLSHHHGRVAQNPRAIRNDFADPLARTGADARIVPLAEQRRDLWDTTEIAEGQTILTRTLGTGTIGPYQLQAAIAALHDGAPTSEQTDWPQILALYDVLTTVAPGPVVTLSRAVAIAMVHRPRAGLALISTLDTDDRMAHTHRLEAVRGHLLEQAGDTAAARQSYLQASKMTASLPEKRYLELRAARLHHPRPPPTQPADPAAAGIPRPVRSRLPLPSGLVQLTG